MDPIRITSDEPVPEIEAAIRAFLSGYPGTWGIQINQRLAGGWWSVKVVTEGFQNIFLIRPEERTPDGILRQLREALRGATPPDDAPWNGVERRSRPRS
jgi:hypothetical protein